MENTQVLKIYFSQYKLLEEKMIEVSEYVAIEPQNYSTFSSQFISLFISICSEIDSLAGEICRSALDMDINFGIINKIDVITQKYTNLKNIRVETIFPFEEISIVPFTKFEANSTSWWTDYNRVKHNRAEIDNTSGRPNYTKANLKNTLYAMAAFYILLITLSKELECSDKLTIQSRLFNQPHY